MEKGRRRDILLLINVLSRYKDQKEYEFYHGIKLKMLMSLHEMSIV